MLFLQQWQKQAVVGAAAIRHNGPCEPPGKFAIAIMTALRSPIVCTGNEGKAILTRSSASSAQVGRSSPRQRLAGSYRSN